MTILKHFHASFDETEKGFLIHRGALKGCEIDLKDCPDLGPILFVLAAMAQGTTHIYNAGRLRIKESDRIEAMRQELKFDVRMRCTDEEVWIEGNPEGYQCGTILQGHNDHRIVMAMTVMALVNQSVCTIEGAQAIRKSYPSFFEDVKKINGKVELL